MVPIRWEFVAEDKAPCPSVRLKQTKLDQGPPTNSAPNGPFPQALFNLEQGLGNPMLKGIVKNSRDLGGEQQEEAGSSMM